VRERSFVGVTIESLLPGIVTAVLALFGGAGGSALLELWWKPRRTRRRVAVLLAYEVNLNLKAMLAHTIARERHLMQVSADFKLSTVAFDALAEQIAELPAHTASQVLDVYHRFERLHRLREAFSATHQRWRDAEAEGRPDVEQLKRYCLAALDGFNTRLDDTITDTRATFDELRRLGPDQGWHELPEGDAREQITKQLQERDARLKRLETKGH